MAALVANQHDQSTIYESDSGRDDDQFLRNAAHSVVVNPRSVPKSNTKGQEEVPYDRHHWVGPSAEHGGRSARYRYETSEGLEYQDDGTRRRPVRGPQKVDHESKGRQQSFDSGVVTQHNQREQRSVGTMAVRRATGEFSTSVTHHYAPGRVNERHTAVSNDIASMRINTGSLEQNPRSPTRIEANRAAEYGGKEQTMAINTAMTLANAADDPRPAKSSTPSRMSALSPINFVVNKYRAHRQHRSDGNDSQNTASESAENKVPSFRVLSRGLQNSSTEGIVNGGITPQPSRRNLANESGRYGPQSHMEEQVQEIETGAYPDMIVEDTRFSQSTREGKLPIADSMQRSEEPASWVHLKLDSPTAEQNHYHSRGGVLASSPTDWNRNISRRPLEEELEEELDIVLHQLKQFQPNNRELSGCQTAKEAAAVALQIFRKADNGWKTNYDQSENLHRELGLLRSQLNNQKSQLDSQAELLATKTKLLAQTEKNLKHTEFENEQLKDNRAADLEAQRTASNAEIAGLRRGYDDLKKSHEDLLKRSNHLEQSAEYYKTENARLNDLVRRGVADIQTEKRNSEQERERLTSEHRASNAAQEMQHLKDTEHLRATIAGFETERKGLTERYEQDMESLRADHRSLIQQIQDDHARALREKDSEQSDAESRLHTQYRGELTRTREDHAAVVETLKRQHSDETRRLQEENDRLRNDARQFKERARQDLVAQERQLRATHQEQLRAAHQEQLREKQRSENLMGALVERESFKGLADAAIQTRFAKLVKTVDRLSRDCQNWDQSRVADWPYPYRGIQAQENPRQIKQYVVQNGIWTLLQENVFDTPFKIFGPSGENLFQQWVESFGGPDTTSEVAASWPQPSENCEKWRYEQVHKCLDAVERSKDATLQNAYSKGIQDVCDLITDDLAHVVATTPRVQKSVKDMVQQAAKLWMELGEQRCRVMIVLTTASDGRQRSYAVETSEDLVVQPEVRRMGNDRGQHLNAPSVVVCKKEVHPLTIR